MNQSQQSDLYPIANSICQSEGFTLKYSLGQGSFKQAFLVVDKEGNRFALKIIRDPSPSLRTLREIESLLRCDHPSIAKLLKIGVHPIGNREYQFLIEEYLAGGTLSSKIGTSSGIDDTAVLAIASVLINTLSQLKSLGLVHRDIKPDNIMFRKDLSTPVLVDFGCVRDLSASSLTESWIIRGPGTPYFASPEQLNNQKPLIDWRSDQFSLGVTLFYARFLAHPYQYPNEPPFHPDTVERVANRGDRRPDLTQIIENTPLLPIEKMTAPWPVERYRTPEELVKDW